MDASDAKTHKIPSSIPWEERPKDHFVTVKGSGDIVLRAIIDPDTPQIRNSLRWSAIGATITSPAIGADRLTAKISRNTKGGAKITVKIKVRSKICKEFLVWVIFCRLKAKRAGRSSLIEDLVLGLKKGERARDAGSYKPEAGIEWIATIFPKRIITDRDHPAIENQVPSNIPADGGVPDSPHTDATRSDFRGWDISRQLRTKGFKGNPDKIPPEPLEETTEHDPQEFFRPQVYPTDDVVGNDDSPESVEDEDCDPYNLGPHISAPPGEGSIGTLRSNDNPYPPFLEDDKDYNGEPVGEDGDTVRIRAHFREFVRVQLGTTWYRCSDFGEWRWHMNAKRLGGKWNAEPGQPDKFDLTNDDF